MKLFEKSGRTLKNIGEKVFPLEKDIQNIIEDNVDIIFGLEFVKSEFAINSFRIDTLCFDQENNAFVIIEYKKGSSYSVIDQGYTYLSILLNHKSDFILEYNESMGKPLKRGGVDWSQSRVIFISPKFNDYQLNSVNFSDIPFELWEIHQFSNDCIGLNPIQQNSKESIGSSSNSKIINNVSKEVSTPTEDFHINKSKNRPEWVKELYYTFKERILALDNVEMKYRKQYISFRKGRPFVDVVIYDKGLGMYINLKKGELEDFKSITQDLSQKGHWGNGDYFINITSSDIDVDYIMSLIKQSHKKQS